MRGLRAAQHRVKADRLIHGESVSPVWLMLIAAVLLLLVGLLAIVSMVSTGVP